MIAESHDTTLGYFTKIMIPFLKYEFSDSSKVFFFVELDLWKSPIVRGTIFGEFSGNNQVINTYVEIEIITIIK